MMRLLVLQFSIHLKTYCDMKSIKEKAEEYAYTNWESDEYHDGDVFDPIGHTQKTFEEGANYVLEEIGKLINYKRWSAQDLYKVIDELKK